MTVPNTQPEELNEGKPFMSLLSALLMMGAVFVGALAAVFVLPNWSPVLAQSLRGPEAHAYWDLARTSGVVAYMLLWLSVVMGLLVTNKMARVFPGGPTAVDLHEFASLLGLSFALFHAVVLLGDQFIKYTPLQIAIPFASFNYEPFWVGLGQIGFYLLIPLTFSFYARRLIGYGAWRWLHFGTFIGYALITVHGLLAGSDTKTPFMLILYASTGISIFFLTFYRVLTIQEVRA